MANDIDETQDAVDPAEAAVALDLLLVDATHGLAYKFRPRTSTVRMGAKLALKPKTVAKRTAALATEMTKVAIGSSRIAPDKRDRRFAPAPWMNNPVLKRVLQSYLAAGKTANDLLEDAELSYDDHERAEFLIRNVNDALAPSNNPLVNPATAYAIKTTKGKSIPRGAKAFATDMKSAPRLPAMVEPNSFEVGKDLAITPGSVVYRSPMFELIQYKPTTEKVYKRPLLVVPPVINKYYAFDLAPGRSMAEYLLSKGHQVFIISWRNPTQEDRDWGFDEYGQSILDALDITRDISGSKKTNLYALCSGGVITTMVLAKLKADGKLDEVGGLGLAVTVLDQDHAGLASAVLNDKTAKAAIAFSAKRGYLDGANLAEAFAWLRPNDLIWNYWVNNYLMGNKPPKFDVLYWNADATRMTAGLHKDFVETGLHNGLVTAGGTTMLGTPVDVSKIDVDSFIVGGLTDHICPWSSCYATTHLLGGKKEFVLSSSGHVAAIVNPPTNGRAKYLVNKELPKNAEKWLAGATQKSGSWWPAFSAWLGRHGGGKVEAPKKVGNKTYKPIQKAPGSYVLEP